VEGCFIGKGKVRVAGAEGMAGRGIGAASFYGWGSRAWGQWYFLGTFNPEVCWGQRRRGGASALGGP